MKTGIVVLFTVLMVGQPAAATQVTDATTVDPGRICANLDPDQLTVAVTTPADAPATISDGTRLFGGSSVTVVLCDSDGEVIPPRGGNEWSVSTGPGIASREFGPRSISLTLAAEETTIDFPARITEKDRETGPRIQVTTGAFVTSELSGVDRIAFPNEPMANTYRKREPEALTAAAAVEANASRLESKANTIREEGLGDGNANRTLRELARAQHRLNETSANATAVLFRATYAGQNATAPLHRLVEKREAATASAARAKQAYRDALTARAARYAGQIQQTVLFALLPGVLLGMVLGAIRPYRRGKKVDRLQSRSATISYDRDVLGVPLIAAVVAILLGLGILIITGVINALLQ